MSDTTKPKYRPWEPSEVPIGKVIQRKPLPPGFGMAPLRAMITATGYSSIVWIGNQSHCPVEDLLENWIMEDGSPCGIPIP